MNLQNAQNYLVPAMGTTRIYAIRETFVEGVPIEADFRSISLDGRPYAPYGVMIDNSQGDGPLVVVINDIGYSITCPAGSTLQMPYPAPLNQSATITGSGLAVVVFADYPVMPSAGSTNFNSVQFADLLLALTNMEAVQFEMQTAQNNFYTSALGSMTEMIALLTEIRDNTAAP